MHFNVMTTECERSRRRRRAETELQTISIAQDVDVTAKRLNRRLADGGGRAQRGPARQPQRLVATMFQEGGHSTCRKILSHGQRLSQNIYLSCPMLYTPVQRKLKTK